MNRERAPALSFRITWIAVLSAQVVLAGLALWFLPHGFPIFHPRFVLGTFAPWCIVATSLTLGQALVFAPRAGARFVPAIPAFWGSAALGLLLVFPQTGQVAARPVGLVALFLTLIAAFTCRGYGLRALLPAALLGVASGQLVARCERPSAPHTAPSHEEPPRRGESLARPVPERLEIGPDLTIDNAALRVTWQGRQTSIAILPALEFDRTSPDGFWSIFTDHFQPLSKVALAATSADALRLWTADGLQRLHVEREMGVVRLEAWTVLDAPVYSHLNSFTTVQVTGHRRLGLRFSASPETWIAVTHADYPTGAPARFAYVDAARRLHVVVAKDAEKGPFVSLAEGPLGTDGSLSVDLVELSDSSRMFARLEFPDFAAQLSTALSPTAGYGVAENSIEFGLAGADLSSPAHLLLTLAASGIGRGWDSVGHRAGAYRNRVVLHLFEPPPPP